MIIIFDQATATLKNVSVIQEENQQSVQIFLYRVICQYEKIPNNWKMTQ